MNVQPIDVIKLMRTYLESKYNVIGSIYLNKVHVFTGPQEENEQAPMQYYVTLLYDTIPEVYEIGDANTQTIVDITAKIGTRIDPEALTGAKEAADAFRQFTINKIRSRELKYYMAANGVTPAPVTVVEETDVPMDPRHPGLHVYYITIELLTYIDTTS